MNSFFSNPQIAMSFCKLYIYLTYTPQTERTFCDICDFHGRILKTEKISDSLTEIDVSMLGDNKYILLILDGDKIINRSFTVTR